MFSYGIYILLVASKTVQEEFYKCLKFIWNSLPHFHQLGCSHVCFQSHTKSMLHCSDFSMGSQIYNNLEHIKDWKVFKPQ